MSEMCDRCGSVGADRRTLWMACLYNMIELAVPFEQVDVWTVEPESISTTTESVPYTSTLHRPDGTTETTTGTFERKHHTAVGIAHKRRFHTLRVCKRCRAEWMAAIEAWFLSTPQGADHDADEPDDTGIGSGIFVRDNGAIREITQEEWDQRADGLNGEGNDPC